MSEASFKFEDATAASWSGCSSRPPSARCRRSRAWSPLLARLLVALRAVPDLLGDHHVLQGRGRGEPGAFYIPFVDFEPTLSAWRSHSTATLLRPSLCVRQLGLLVLQFLCLHRLAGRHLHPWILRSARSSWPSPIHRGQLRRPPLRCRRRHGRLRAGPHPVQAQVRQHHDVRGADLAGHCRDQLWRRSLVGLQPRSPLPCSFSSPAPSASFHPHPGQRRHPVLDHFPAHPAAHRGDDSDLHHVPGRGFAHTHLALITVYAVPSSPLSSG